MLVHVLTVLVHLAGEFQIPELCAHHASNRLVQVNLLGTAGIQADGRLLIDPLQGMTLGDLVCRHAYDAMGRLMWRRTPTNEGFTQLQRKDYYYDGVRRIQENIARPSSLSQGGGEGGGGSGGGTPTGPELLGGPGNDELPLDTQGGSAALECAAFPASQGQLPGGGVPPPIDPPVLECEEPEQINTLRWTDREYVYGPGYVDEFILQLDQSGNLLYMLQDANYNVVAIISGGCVSGDCGTGVPPVGTLLEQYAYEPYGTVLAADNLDVDQFGVTRHAVNRVGFQGLFFERYDGSYFEPSIAPGVAGMYYARNRFYSPTLGRFLQRDPNETGIPIIAALAMSGEATAILFGGFDVSALYGDGMNLYEFAGSNPVNRRDPSGLDEWDDFDDALSDLNGQRLATTGYIQTAAGWMLIGITSSLNVASSLLGFDVFNSAKNIISGGGTFWDYLDVGLTLAGPLAKAGKLVAKFGIKAGSKAGKWGREMLERGYKRCNCFVAGTLVDTPDGPVSIESIQEGDEVLTRDQTCPTEAPKPGRVSRVFRNFAPAILWLSLANGQVIGTTPGHEVWTQQSGWKFAGQLTVGEDFIDQEGKPVGITGIALEARPTVVYNLEVDGSFTYFANGVWVHNNSCDLWPTQKWNKMAGEAYQDWINTLMGFVRNTERLPSGHVPDILDRGKGIIGDIKSGERIEMTEQLSAIAKYGRENGLTPILVVSESNVKHIATKVTDLFELRWGP